MLFAKHYLKSHPKSGEPTGFVPRIWKAMAIQGYGINRNSPFLEAESRYYDLHYVDIRPKWHTVRRKQRWTAGDKMSTKIWSGVPYVSKKIQICDDVFVDRTQDVRMYVEGLEVDTGSPDAHLIAVKDLLPMAENDGFDNIEDFANWLGVGFLGQIIFWHPELKY